MPRTTTIALLFGDLASGMWDLCVSLLWHGRTLGGVRIDGDCVDERIFLVVMNVVIRSLYDTVSLNAIVSFLRFRRVLVSLLTSIGPFDLIIPFPPVLFLTNDQLQRTRDSQSVNQRFVSALQPMTTWMQSAMGGKSHFTYTCR